MKIVIDISEEHFLACKHWLNEGVANFAETIIANGTPLPKGHGRLKDVDKILNEIRKREEEPNYQHEGEDWCVGMCMTESIIESAQTIIGFEAYKGE